MTDEIIDEDINPDEENEREHANAVVELEMFEKTGSILYYLQKR